MSGVPPAPPPVVKDNPIDAPIKKLIETQTIYPTEHHLSYIQTKDPVKIQIRGEEEDVKSFGINDLQFPGQKLNLCGDGPTKNKVTGIDFFKTRLNSVYESAKNVEFKQSYPLPWENDKQSKYLISEMEILEEKVKYLAMLLKKVYVNDQLEEFEKTNEEHVRALPSFYEANTVPEWGLKLFPVAIEFNLMKCLSDLHVLKVESQFKKNLRRWMEGCGKLSEYPEDAINWAPSSIWTNINQFKNIKAEDLKGLLKFFENTNPTAYNLLKKFSDTVHLRNVNPNIGQGFILEEDILKWKTSTFLELLKKTPPKNDCEAYLFYKYLILKKQPNFDYIYDEKIQQYLKEKENEDLETELKKKQAEQEQARQDKEEEYKKEHLKLLNKIAEDKKKKDADDLVRITKEQQLMKDSTTKAIEEAKKKEKELMKPYIPPKQDYDLPESYHTIHFGVPLLNPFFAPGSKERTEFIAKRKEGMKTLFTREKETMALDKTKHDESIKYISDSFDEQLKKVDEFFSKGTNEEKLKHTGNPVEVGLEIDRATVDDYFLRRKLNEYSDYLADKMTLNAAKITYEQFGTQAEHLELTDYEADLDMLYEEDIKEANIQGFADKYGFQYDKTQPFDFQNARKHVEKTIVQNYGNLLQKIQNEREAEVSATKQAELVAKGVSEEDAKKQIQEQEKLLVEDQNKKKLEEAQQKKETEEKQKKIAEEFKQKKAEDEKKAAQLKQKEELASKTEKKLQEEKKKKEEAEKKDAELLKKNQEAWNLQKKQQEEKEAKELEKKKVEREAQVKDTLTKLHLEDWDTLMADVEKQVPVAKSKAPPQLPPSSPPKADVPIQYKTGDIKTFDDLSNFPKKLLQEDADAIVNKSFKEENISNKIMKEFVTFTGAETDYPELYYATLIKKNKEVPQTYNQSEFIKLIDESQIVPSVLVLADWQHNQYFNFAKDVISEESKKILTETDASDLRNKVIQDINDRFAYYGPALYLTTLKYDGVSYKNIKRDLVQKITAYIMHSGNYTTTQEVKLSKEETIYKPILRYIDHLLFKQMLKGEGTIQAYEKEIVKMINKYRTEAKETPNQLGEWNAISSLYSIYKLEAPLKQVLERTAGKATYKKKVKKT